MISITESASFSSLSADAPFSVSVPNLSTITISKSDFSSSLALAAFAEVPDPIIATMSSYNYARVNAT